jgi:CO/xanthine dehydrogenase Mo-binding subunit
MSEEFTQRVPRRFLGKYRPKIDGPEKASGKARYADDLTIKMRFPDLLYARVMHSPHPHARIRKFDLSKAEALPGVAAIMTYKDPEFASLKLTNAGWTDCVDTVPWDRMMFQFRDRRVLGEYACWVGDEMGFAVAAESEEIADEALRLIDVDWEILPFVLDPIEAMKAEAPLVHQDLFTTPRRAPWTTGAVSWTGKPIN